MIGFTARPVMGGLYARTLIKETTQMPDRVPSAQSGRHARLQAAHA